LEDWAARALTVRDDLLDIGLDLRLVQKELERIRWPIRGHRNELQDRVRQVLHRRAE
jgi:hypothetical protein